MNFPLKKGQNWLSTYHAIKNQHAACLISASGTHPRRRHSSQKRANWRSKRHGKERWLCREPAAEKKKKRSSRYSSVPKIPRKNRNSSKPKKWKKMKINKKKTRTQRSRLESTLFPSSAGLPKHQIQIRWNEIPPLQPHRPPGGKITDLDFDGSVRNEEKTKTWIPK